MQSKITIFDMTLPAYGTIALIGTVIITILGIIVVWHRKLCIESFFKIECVGGTSALIGAKLWDMVTTSIEGGNSGISLDAFMNSGFSFYGGVLFGLVGVIITAFVLRVDFHCYAKYLIFLVALLHGIWKLGCFMGGCCYGIPYNGPLSVVFPEGVKAPAGIPLFPVQLLEAGISFIMSAVFFIKGRKKQWKHPVLEYIGCYSLLRFFVEFLRFHNITTIISVAQAVSLVCLCIVVLCLFLMKKRMGIKGRTNE